MLSHYVNGDLGSRVSYTTWLMFERSGSVWVESSFADVVDVGLESDSRCLLRHTLAKWPSLPQMLQGRLNAGHRAQQPRCSLPPQPGQVPG